MNTLARNDREQLLQRLESLRANRDLVLMTGQESIDRIVSQGRWRIFHDWTSATSVTFRVAPPKSRELGVQLLGGKYIVKSGETPKGSSLAVTYELRLR